MSIAVFASGDGSNFEALVERSRNLQWPRPITLLVTDKADAGALDRARKLGISAVTVRPQDYESKEAYESVLLSLLREKDIEWILLAGFMRILGSVLLKAYPWRILNVHPSLLPAFQGKNALKQALAYGVRWSGVTVHWVDEGVDTGPIIDQKPILVEPDDTVETLQRKAQFVEHNLYPAVVYKLLTGKIQPPKGTPAD